MKYILTLEQFIEEGVYDPGILKAFFMAGGPGSGKSYVATELFDFPKGSITSVSYATGLKLINSDNMFERGLKDAGYSADELAKLAKDPEKWTEIMTIRDRAKGLTKKLQDNYLAQRLGQVIDGTGKDYNRISDAREIYQNLGYDTYMIFVNTSLEVALERNRQRERQLDDRMVEKMWKEVQNNLGRFQKLFGSDKMLIVDNSATNSDMLNRIERQITKHINAPVQNILGKRWIEQELESRRSQSS